MPETEEQSNTYQLRRESRTAEGPESRPRPWRRRLLAGGIALGVITLAAIGAAVWYRLTFVPTLSARVQSSVVKLAPRVDGRVEDVLVSEYDHVTTGQVVARLEGRELQAALQAAEADLAIRESALLQAQAQEALRRAQVEADVVMAEARVAVARARVESLNEQIELRRQRLPEQIRQANATVAQREAELERILLGARAQEVESARERLASAETTLRLYELEVQQSRQLVDEGIDSQYILEVRKTRLETQRHAVRQAQLALELLEAGPRPQDVQVAREALEHARASLSQVELGGQEIRKLGRDLEVCQAELLEAEAALKQAHAGRAEIEVAEQRTRGAATEVERQQALVSGRQAALADTAIVSPVNGVITRVYADVGEIAPKGVAIVLVSDSSKPRWIDAFVDEEDARLVAVGQTASLRVPANSSTEIEALVKQVGLHTATLDHGGGGGGATAFNQPDRVWVKLVPIEPLDESIVTGTTARGTVRVR